MVLIALLLVALACLALGLVLASAPWLVASLAASAVAAVLLWRKRARFAAARPPAPKHVQDAPAAARTTAPEPVSAPPADGDVWVVDGRPDYHVAGCALISDDVCEPVPLAQATEDGFAPCAQCQPDTPRADIVAGPSPDASGVAEPDAIRATPGAVVASSPSSEVWVVDGRPRYHEADCLIIQGQDAEPIPLEQAAEDGFMPCSLCEPAVTGVR